MIVLTVLRYNGAPCEPLAASFDELGGSIGRAPTNQLVLPDPDRTVSRVHAEVVLRNGGHAVIDRGSNPVLLNGQALGNGREQPLRDGDELQIGGYALRVSVGQPPSASDPFADLFEPARPAAPAAAASTPKPSPPSAPRQPASAAGLPAAGIPDDWDPFAPDAAAAADPLAGFGRPDDGPAASSPLGLPVAAPSHESSLDDLFGLAGHGHGAGDPFGATDAALQPPPNTAADDDPLRALSQSAPQRAAPVSDHASELNMPWQVAAPSPPALPPAADATVGAPGAAAGATPGAGTGALPGRMVYSWERPSRDGRVIGATAMPSDDAAAPASAAAAAPVDPIAGDATDGSSMTLIVGPGDRAADKAPARPVPDAPARPVPDAPAMRPVPPASAAAPAAGAAAGPARSSSGASAEAGLPSAVALTQALYQGLGLPLPAAGVGPEEMGRIGELLRESTRGAVELLLARATLKREMRADVTMIVARENNPLKFSPTVEVALQHLLGPATPGFMPPVAAMRDAFDDLRAHQLGVMAGMRAALEGVLERFDPAQLEGQLTRRSAACPPAAVGPQGAALGGVPGALRAAVAGSQRRFPAAVRQGLPRRLRVAHRPARAGPTAADMLALEVALLSDPGGRTTNEDACGHWHSDRRLCCVLADGAGGHGGGDVASQLAVRHLLSALRRRHGRCRGRLGRAGARRQPGAACRPGARHRCRSMHTTVVCLVIDFVDHRAHWAHAGDSRLYWFRDGRLIDRTRDHSLVQSLVDAGMLDEEALRTHPQRSELRSALGVAEHELEVAHSDAARRVERRRRLPALQRRRLGAHRRRHAGRAAAIGCLARRLAAGDRGGSRPAPPAAGATMTTSPPRGLDCGGLMPGEPHGHCIPAPAA